MKILRSFFIFFLCFSLTGCSQAAAESRAPSADSEYFSQRDLDADYDQADCQVIDLSAEAKDGSVTISAGGSYILRGELQGMVMVNAPEEKVRLILEGAQIHSESSAAIYVKDADKVFVTLAPGSENSLSNSGEFTAIDDSSIDGTVFARSDLSINGSGSLDISSPGGHGIVCKDSLCITGGSFTIDCASHGLSAKENICISGGDFAVTAGKDGIQAQHDEDEEQGYVYLSGGDFDISSGDDGISASAYVLIEDGSFSISCGGGCTAVRLTQSPDMAPDAQSPQNGGMAQGAQPPQNGGMGPGGQMPQNSGMAQGGQMPRNGGMGPGGQGARNFEDFGEAAPGRGSGGMQLSPISSVDDSMRAIKAGSDISILSGSFVIDSAGDGIHSNRVLSLSGGELEISAGDDALNGEDNILISGGRLRLTAYGDGIDSNGSLEISGGEIFISGPAAGDSSIIDYAQSAVITGGSFCASGAKGMGQSFTQNTQGLICHNVGRQSAGSTITLSDSEGRELAAFTPQLDYSMLMISLPQLVSGENYSLSVGSQSLSICAA